MTTADDDNPYRTPQAELAGQTNKQSARQSAWRDGPFLVVRRTFKEYPDRCIACNSPAEGRYVSMRVRRDRSVVVLVVLCLILGPFPLVL